MERGRYLSSSWLVFRERALRRRSSVCCCSLSVAPIPGTSNSGLNVEKVPVRGAVAAHHPDGGRADSSQGYTVEAEERSGATHQQAIKNSITTLCVIDVVWLTKLNSTDGGVLWARKCAYAYSSKSLTVSAGLQIA